MKKQLLAIAISGLAAFASAQSIYEPTRSAEAQGMSLVGWGSGTIAESDEVVQEGGNSIRISSRNFFQGGKIMFTNPVDLSGAVTQKENLIRFSINIPDGSASASGGAGGRGGAQGGEGEGGGAMGGLGAPGSGGRSGGGQAGPALQSIAATKIRVVITTTDGKHAEAYLDLTTSLKDPSGWMNVGIPLVAINGFAASNQQVKSIAISSDSTATIYLGGANVIKDGTPVFAEPNVRELNLAFGDEFTFAAAGSAGATPVKFLWDFDAADGISADAEGQTVKRRFRKDGTFTVTLTAVDIYGLKQPYRTTIQVIVNP